MLFGVKLSNEIYPAWKDHYISYEKLKKLLKESSIPSNFNDYDEEQFVKSLDAELEKVYTFQSSKYNEVSGKIDQLETKISKIEDLSAFDWQKFQQDLDNLLSEAKELDHFTRLNFTGFQKIIKKHDRLHPNYNSSKALLSIRLKELPFHSEDYSPLLNKVSSLFQVLRTNFQSASYLSESNSYQTPGNSTLLDSSFQSFKFWIHPDNLMEVKTRILRHLPVLIYSNDNTNLTSSNNNYQDPTITSLYFDNENFELYNSKLLKSNKSPSLRLRWSGKLVDKPDIFVEKKIVEKDEENLDNNSRDVKLKVKEKFLNELIIDHNVEDFKAKTVSKLKEMGASQTVVDNLSKDIDEIDNFIINFKLQPTLRSVYTRTAFEIPGDDRIRVTIDSDILFIREDSFDNDRPIRDPSNWHREDIDSNIANPYQVLRKNEFVKFPHSVMEIKIKSTGNRNNRNGISIPFSRKHGKWIEDLTTSHLVKEVPNFSKFIQGLASLFLEDERLEILPFWLPDLEEDIRKDPKDAFEEEASKRLKYEEVKTKLDRFESSQSNNAQNEDRIVDLEDNESSDEENNYTTTAQPKRKHKPIDILPFLTGGSKLANVDSEDEEVELPVGVNKPTKLLKQAGPIKIEAKVWLANERTFNRWLSVTSLFSVLTFSINSSVKHSGNPHLATGLSYVYFVLTLFTGAWGYYIYNKRLTLIKLRDGKHLDAPLGPLVVTLGVLGAIVINFIVGFRSAAAKHQQLYITGVNDDVHPLVNWVNTQMFKLVGADGY